MSYKKIYLIFSMIGLLSYARVVSKPIVHDKKGTETINEEVTIDSKNGVAIKNEEGNIVFKGSVKLSAKTGIEVKKGQVLLSSNVDINAKKVIELGDGEKNKVLISDKKRKSTVNINGDIHIGKNATLRMDLNKNSSYSGNIESESKSKLKFNLDNSSMKANVLSGEGIMDKLDFNLKNNSILTLKYGKKRPDSSSEHGSNVKIEMDNSILNLVEPDEKYFNLQELQLNNSILNFWETKYDDCKKCSICSKCKIDLDNRKVLNIRVLNGDDGTINIDATQQQLIVLSGSGNYNISQKHSGISRLTNYLLDNKEGLLFATDMGNVLNFESKENEEPGSLKKYKLVLNKENYGTWYITDILENDASIVTDFKDDGATLYNIGLTRHEIDALHQRMGELNLMGHKVGIWARVGTGKHQKCDNFYLLQVGIDRRVNPNLLLGLSLSNKYNNIKYAHGKGFSNITSLSAYLTYLNDKNRYYIDLIGKYSSIKNKYDLKFSTFEDGAIYTNSSLSIGAELGKKYMINKDISITPMLQGTYTYIGENSYKTNRGINVDVDFVNSFIGKLGINLGYKTHYIKLGILHEFFGDVRYVATDKNGVKREQKQKNRNTWLSLGLGGTFNINENSYIYYDFEKTFSNCMYNKWQISLGYRYEF